MKLHSYMKCAIKNTKQCFIDDNVKILSIDAIHDGSLCVVKATTINNISGMSNSYKEVCGIKHLQILEKKYKKLNKKQKAVISQ